jgi:hypothetical protein
LTELFVVLGGGAFVVSTVLAALTARRAAWLGWQAFTGVFVAVLTWKIASSAGAFADPDPEGCSDCGESAFWGLLLLAGNITGWLLGIIVGGLFGLARRRSRVAGDERL